MTDLDLVIRAPRLVSTEGEVSRVVGVKDGTIVAVEPMDSDLSAPQVIELAGDEALLPGVVDSHVHVNDPGRTEWEGFASATRAAAAGGVTTIVDMPLNSIPPTVDVAALEVKRKTAENQAHVDVGFWGGAVPGNVADLRPLYDAGVFGFKCFLLHSGVDEFAPLDPGQLEAAMREIASFDGLMIVHAEDSHAIEHAPTAHGERYRDFLSSRPRGAENLAIAHVIELARWTGCRVHILHVSSSDALPMIASAKRDGIGITAETCPHYLTFTAEEITDGATQYKCCPPIREGDNRELLWRGLRDGVIDLVVSDHSPSTPDLKCLDIGDFGVAWGGISSLQLGLPAVWTQARQRGFDLVDVCRWMCQAPAKQTGLRRKGRIDIGYDADFCVFAPDDAFVVDVHRLHHKNALTPYDGRPLAGQVRATWLRGKQIDIDDEPQGRLLNRGAASSSNGRRYYAPTGGHPPQTELTTDRAVFTEAYAVLPRGTMRDIVTSNLPFWEGTRLWVIARPLSGFAETFSQYIVEVAPGGGSDRPELDPGAEGVLFVVAGGFTLTISGEKHDLSPGGYAFLPPGCEWTVRNGTTDAARFHWIRKAYEHVDGIETPEPFVTNETDVDAVEMPGTDGRWSTQRFVDPLDVRHDMHVNIVNFGPGGVIPFPETHVMEHGLYVLEGKAVYLLNKDWVEVQEGDFMWLRAFCPQACYAGGPGRFRYLLYKDVNRHAKLSRQFL